MSLDLSADGAALTAAITDIESVSGGEERLAAEIAAALRPLPHLTVHTEGAAVVARTMLGRPQRMILAGHIDTASRR